MRLHKIKGGDAQHIRRHTPPISILSDEPPALITEDMLLSDSEERRPDEDFRLRFEALTRLDPDKHLVKKELIDGRAAQALGVAQVGVPG